MFANFYVKLAYWWNMTWDTFFELMDESQLKFKFCSNDWTYKDEIFKFLCLFSLTLERIMALLDNELEMADIDDAAQKMESRCLFFYFLKIII